MCSPYRRAPLFLVVSLLTTALGAPAPPQDPVLFGHYVGTASVSTSSYYPPGAYDAEVVIAQTPSGVVGYVNVAFDPADLLGGIISYTFSGATNGTGQIVLEYSDRICGAGSPLGKCYPHKTGGNAQYSFQGSAVFQGSVLTLPAPTVQPGLHYVPELPFDTVTATRLPNRPRSGFDGAYLNFELIYMGTALFPTPLPLVGSNNVIVEKGDILQWEADSGFTFPVGSLQWCFDDGAGRGWMSQQGVWDYDWTLAPDGSGLSVIVTFPDPAGPPDCSNLQDPLLQSGLDLIHDRLVAVMIEVGVPSAEVVRLGHPANPAALLPGVTTGPAIGSVWDPVIDHAAFMPSATLDVLGVGIEPQNFSAPPYGTVLCSPLVFLYLAFPSTPFAVAIPDDVSIVGVPLCAQGASWNGVDILLTNAIDFTLGTH